LIESPGDTGKLAKVFAKFGLLGYSSNQPLFCCKPLTQSVWTPVWRSVPEVPPVGQGWPPMPTQLAAPPFGVTEQFSAGTVHAPLTWVTGALLDGTT
jgi:hypothetical protein